MGKQKKDNVVQEPASALTYGMSAELRKEEPNAGYYEELVDNQQPYTMEELNARIDEAEEEIDRGEDKSFEEMMSGFKKELLWLK